MAYLSIALATFQTAVNRPSEAELFMTRPVREIHALCWRYLDARRMILMLMCNAFKIE